jgi:Dyp-type peroxidase family
MRATAAPELHDVQGLVARGYGSLTAARFLLLGFDEPADARAWAGAVAPTLTPGDERPHLRAVNLAFTSSGLRGLGLPHDVVHRFSNEFADGMTTPHRRRILGDRDANAPERWEWGGPRRPVDAVLLLFARGRRELDALEQEQQRLLAAGVRVVGRLETSDLQGYEPFGFRDGISQPLVEGLSKTGPPELTVRFGEFVLGYPNEYGRYTDRPVLDRTADPGGLLPPAPDDSGRVDLGRNGTYLVFRQMRQDVGGFWRFLDGATRRPDGSPDAERRLRLAAKMVGRWPEGSPLALAPEHNDPALEEGNDFGYAVDPRGVRCPLGAHVRRANPRDSLDPRPGTERSLAINRRHRILRRGREYGPPLTIAEALRGEDGAEERGLHFICLNANIARQFEFVHDTWLNNPKFAGLYDDSDPLVSPSHPFGGTFTIPSEGVRERVSGVPRFVSVRGGAYFFLPGIAATRYLTSLA